MVMPLEDSQVIGYGLVERIGTNLVGLLKDFGIYEGDKVITLQGVTVEPIDILKEKLCISYSS